MTRGSIAAVALLFTFAAWPVHAGRADAITSANESSAIVSLKAISTAQMNYRLTCGNGAYAASLVVLRTPPGKVGDGFIDASLGSSAKPEKSGFIFSVTPAAGSNKGPADCNGTPTVTNFYATAVPVSAKTGTRSFALNQNDVIWTQKGSKAPTEPFGPPAQQIAIKK